MKLKLNLFIGLTGTLLATASGCGQNVTAQGNNTLATDVNAQNVAVAPSGNGVTVTENNPATLPPSQVLNIKDIACIGFSNSSAYSVALATVNGKTLAEVDITNSILPQGVGCQLLTNSVTGNTASFEMTCTNTTTQCSASIPVSATVVAPGKYTNLTASPGAINNSCDTNGAIAQALGLLYNPQAPLSASSTLTKNTTTNNGTNNNGNSTSTNTPVPGYSGSAYPGTNATVASNGGEELVATSSPGTQTTACPVNQQLVIIFGQ